MSIALFRHDTHVVIARAMYPVCAHQDKWPFIARSFRKGLNTYQIGLALGLDEFAVANVLRDALRTHREKADG